MLIPKIDGLQLHSLIEKHNIVFVEFWAAWCAPCQQFAMIYEKEAQYHSDIVFAKVDVEEQAELANTLQIRSIPHVVVFKNAQLVYSESGSMPASALNDLINQAKELEVEK